MHTVCPPKNDAFNIYVYLSLRCILKYLDRARNESTVCQLFYESSCIIFCDILYAFLWEFLYFLSLDTPYLFPYGLVSEVGSHVDQGRPQVHEGAAPVGKGAIQLLGLQDQLQVQDLLRRIHSGTLI